MSSVAAQAADLAVQRQRTPNTINAAAYSWTGFYAGVNAGYGFGGRDDVNTEGQAAPNIANIAGGARPGFVPLDRAGFIGGGHIGYNYQIGQMVAGIESDISYTDFRDSANVGTFALGSGAPLNNRFSSNIDYLGTVRGRIGWTYDRTLFYGTGGLAYGEVKQQVQMFGPTGNVEFTGENNQLKAGYVVGAGVEYAMTNTLSVKGEYLFYDLGNDTINVAVIPGSGGGGTGYNSHFNNDGQIFRVGLNYKPNYSNQVACRTIRKMVCHVFDLCLFG
jgi:outer membrane immunogenic protein